jgi:hypothetical protein
VARRQPPSSKKLLPEPLRCGARCLDGHSCRRWPVRGKARCPKHGGLSTGPRTEEGRARIAQSNRNRALLKRKKKEEMKCDSPLNSFFKSRKTTV